MKLFSGAISHGVSHEPEAYLELNLTSTRGFLRNKILLKEKLNLKCVCNKLSLSTALKASNFVKKRVQQICFPVIIPKVIETAFSIEQLRWMLLLN